MLYNTINSYICKILLTHKLLFFMKIKTLFVCFLAVCAISLSSCKKEKETATNYAEKFVGTYVMTITPEILGMDGSDGVTVEPITGLTCTIENKSTKNEVTVTVNMPAVDGISIPFILDATCDESGMNIREKAIDTTIPNDLFGEITLSLSLSQAKAALPVDNKINWSAPVTGNITMGGFPIPFDGSLKFEGTKN